MSQLLVSGRLFEWNVIAGATEFTQFIRLGDSDAIDVLRITSADSGFDVAIRVLSGQYSDGEHRFLGPLLVVGGHFPNKQQPLQPGILIELRPKLRALTSGEPNSATVERVIQWCNSSSFKPVRVNPSGGRWVGYGHTSEA